MEAYGYFIVVAVITVFFAYQSVTSKRKRLERMRLMIDESFGKRPSRTYKYEEYERIKRFFENTACNDEGAIDDITWNDLAFDNVFKALNHTYSSIGEEYLYKLARTLNFNKQELEEFSSMSEYFLENREEAKKVQMAFANLGRTRSIAFYDFIHSLQDLDKGKNGIHYFCIVLAVVTIGTFFINPLVAIALLIGAFSFNIYTYYKYKGGVASYFVCCKYLVGLVEQSSRIEKMQINYLETYNKKIRELNCELKYLTKNMYLVDEMGVSDSLLGVVLEYVKMIFHVDLIKFNNVLRETKEKVDKIDELFNILGRIESAIAVASFKAMLLNEYGAYAKPDIIRKNDDNTESYVSFENIYHPLISDAVKNTMAKEKNVLLTGSNASGKSTFLKTVAINAILSQTLGLACADKFTMRESLVYSSMALRDDLDSNESYYIVEIKSLKRIVDKAENGNRCVMCFIDEVLRGTNTVERIAASSSILEKLAVENTICFAATHDVELTKILESDFTNYHFEEEVKDDDVLFNYQLKTGPATTRNAIKLLKLMGYKNEIIEKADERAGAFLRTGIW